MFGYSNCRGFGMRETEKEVIVVAKGVRSFKKIPVTRD